MVPIQKRTPEACVHRQALASPVGGATHVCGLVHGISGARDDAFGQVKPEQCLFCCEHVEPTVEAPNGLVASLLLSALFAIKKVGGVDGCDEPKATSLMKFAAAHLPVIPAELLTPRNENVPPYSSACRFLGKQTGEQMCKTCRGNVRQKVFACHHPRHKSDTSIRDCMACEDYQPGADRQKVEKWAIGVTTAPRGRATLRDTLKSLRRAGWTEEVHVFAEPDSPVQKSMLGSRPLNIVRRTNTALGAWGNFLLSLSELYLRTPDADAYLMVQDDVIFCRGLKDYLQQQLWPGPKPGVVSLHTPSHLTRDQGTGFFQADLGWNTWGAQAFVFSNASARAFLADVLVIDHRLKGILGGMKNVDSVIGDWCHRTGFSFWMHTPSLAEHIGETSTLWKTVGLGGKRSSADFPGEQTHIVDALTKHRETKGAKAPAPLMRARHNPVKHHADATDAPHGPIRMLHKGRIGVIVTAHAGYLHFLPECLAAWDEQRPEPKVLVLDDCDYTPPEGWEVIRGNWHHPNPARNAGIAACEDCLWIIHWDADNVPPSDFLQTAQNRTSAVGDDIAVLYPDVTVAAADGSVRLVSDGGGGDPRENFFVDTASVWRRDAIIHIGGWSSVGDKLDDWHLACRLHGAGWGLQRLGTTVTARDHVARRTHSTSLGAAVWKLRPLGIIILLAGREDMLEPMIKSILAADLPPVCGLTIVDDSGSDVFHVLVQKAVKTLSPRFQRVSLIRSEKSTTLEGYAAIHAHVGSLYSRALSATPEPIILTWEDDVLPLSSGALRLLSDEMLPKRRIAAISGAYRSRQGDEIVVASLEAQRWGNMPTFAWLGNEVKPVGMVGGGFTLWSRAALEQCPILGGCSTQDGSRLGWDGFVCRRLTDAGWKFLLHGGVQCEHRCA